MFVKMRFSKEKSRHRNRKYSCVDTIAGETGTDEFVLLTGKTEPVKGTPTEHS